MVHSFAPVSAVNLCVARCVNMQNKMKFLFVVGCAEAILFIFKVLLMRDEQMNSWQGD